MSASETIQALASITDEGLFELLATAVLREDSPRYASLVHSGVNAAGKTVKAPLDGICFVSGADPPHLIAVHHTITARADLQKKWLHDPSTVKRRKNSRSAAPPGDLIKTAEIVVKERKTAPAMKATLVLTTNEEPGQEIVRALEEAARAHNIEIDLWPRSRLGHFLDNNPTGQWLRHKLLQIDQELLSPELLHELSKKSLEVNRPHDDARNWVQRALDTTLASSLRHDVTFLVAGSGQGKSIACYRKLAAHVEAGGCGIVLPHDVTASAMTLDQAVAAALRQLHPILATMGQTALSLCSHERPLLLIVEDIHRSGQPQLLAEKIAGWTRPPAKDQESLGSDWRLVCPIWPEILAALGDQTRKRVEPMLIFSGGFTESEGCAAIRARAHLGGLTLSSMRAAEISRALGHDPLLIALHDLDKAPDPQQVINQFVDASLSRIATAVKDHPAADYRAALRLLAGEMLIHRQIELSWREVHEWAGVQGELLRLLSQLAHQGELIRFIGPSGDQCLSFRHDRVRDWLLADAAAELERRNVLPDHVVAEPYFAEVVGTVLARNSVQSGFLESVAEVNPLALFHALRLFGEPSQPHHHAITQAIDRWLAVPAAHDRSNLHLRFEALAMLAETDSPRIPALVRKFRDMTSSGQLARLRNGDLSGGIELCMGMEPGVTASWRDIQIEHAKLRYGTNLCRALDGFLRREDLDGPARIGALRLGGHIGDHSLASAIEACWNTDDQRSEHLADYLWAAAQCCGDDPERFLGPVCDAWARLSDEPVQEGWPSPRDNLAADQLRWAFRKWPPLSAIDYFIQRGTHEDLRWPITYMLHNLDHPKALSFVVQGLAAIQKRNEGTGSFPVFLSTAKDEWRRAQQEGRPMSGASRDLLLQLWRNEANNRHLRKSAFSLWAATQEDSDLDVLRASGSCIELADDVLSQRLIRGDQHAIPAMINKVQAKGVGFWWHYGRHVWSSELTEALDGFLGKDSDQGERIWGKTFEVDHATSEMIMRLPATDAERLLLKHWDHLRFRPCFVQAALYVSVPRLLAAAQAAISECPQPAELLSHLCSHFGIGISGGAPGLTREAQVVALAPYLDFLSAIDLWRLWNACNDHGWLATRRDLLDGRLKPFVEQTWSRDSAMLRLDEIATRRDLFQVGILIDNSLKMAVLWTEITATLDSWLEVRRSFEALQVVASAIQQRGTREDLNLLRTYKGMPLNLVEQLIADTGFAVRRRTIR